MIYITNYSVPLAHAAVSTVVDYSGSAMVGETRRTDAPRDIRLNNAVSFTATVDPAVVARIDNGARTIRKITISTLPLLSGEAQFQRAPVRSIRATSLSRSSAVRSRASQIVELPARSANSRYHVANSRSLWRFSTAHIPVAVKRRKQLHPTHGHHALLFGPPLRHQWRRAAPVLY